MKIKKKFETNKSNLKVYLITLSEPEEIEVQLDKDKEPEIIFFDKFLLMTEKELKEKEIEISSLQFLKMLEGTDIPVMIGFEKFTFGDFRISREKQKGMAYEVLKMPPDEELVNIVFDEKIIKLMDTLIKSRSKGTKCDICDKRIYFFQKSSIIEVLNDETITIHKKCRFFK